MKINSSIIEATPVGPLPGNRISSCLTKLGRRLTAALCVALVSAAAPSAFAAVPNGQYEFTSASGSVKFDGNTIDLPESAVKKIAGVVNGTITIQNKTLQLNKYSTKKVIKNLGDDLDFDASVSVSGPNSITLSKELDGYIGRTERPIVTAFEANFHGEDFSGELNTNVTAKVDGKILRLIITFSGDALGSNFSGKLVVVAKR